MRTKPSKKVEDAKLARDFQTTLQEFQKVQQLAAERESTYSPSAPSSIPPASSSDEYLALNMDQENQPFLVGQKRQVLQLLLCHLKRGQLGTFSLCLLLPIPSCFIENEKDDGKHEASYSSKLLITESILHKNHTPDQEGNLVIIKAEGNDSINKHHHRYPKIHGELQWQEVLFLGNEIAFNEAIIEEREQGIKEIQDQIGQANEIFRDLAVLVHEQGVVIDDIHSNIEASSAATTQATAQLSKASKSVKSRSSWRERERAREGERECAGECDGEEGDEGSAPRSRRKECKFIVESKEFEIIGDERKGKIQVLIVEKKGGVSSWVRLGSNSLGLFLEGLNLCIKDEKEARWGREWKEQGRTFYMSRGINKAGGFIRLGVSDLERKHFCIFIPRGRKEKRGWMTMAEKLKEVIGSFVSKSETQEGKAMGKIVGGCSYATIAKRALLGNQNTIVVKVRREESMGLLKKLEHCVVASRKGNLGGDDDLEKLGQLGQNRGSLKAA
ncbi:Syntaxin-21 [Vitis vinifera]|uniref:Syntaxin-21 n=1 Tax=Vitis vinifera TaxID=29760 RepID=A0A438EBM3_VITVI|nr:Syntaxin-21 [Vitis vinifera]